MDTFLVPAELDLAGLRTRLRKPRAPQPTAGGDDWSAGMPPAFLRALVEYWLDGYDWPAAATRLNRYPHAVAEAGRTRLHFVHAGRPGAPAVVLLHGWPYSFAEMLPLVDRLAGDFEVVVPSLPGFVYSPALSEPFSDVAAARAVHTLMTDVLGHRRYLTYGEDVGTWISDRLAGTYPDAVSGIAVTHAAFPPDSVRSTLGPTTEAFFARLDELWSGERGYSAIQATKPDTLAAAIGDSPAGLAAWIIEKFHGWRDPASDFTVAYPLDDLITTVMLYWITDSIGTSFRAYFDDPEVPSQPSIEVPAAIAIPVREQDYPRELAEYTYKDIRSFTRLGHGGHFVAREAPDDIAALIRTLA